MFAMCLERDRACIMIVPITGVGCVYALADTVDWISLKKEIRIISC